MAREYAPGGRYADTSSEGRTNWVKPDRIVHIKDLPEYQHYFSPRTTRGQKKALEKLFAERDNIRFEHNLEQGWTQREKNSRKPANKGEWRMLTNANGNPYLAPIGPAKGKFVMFDAWQSNDELMEIYKEAFEEEWVPGKKVRGVYEFVDPHQHFEEPDGGHIIRIDYNSKMKVMMVHFRNKGSVVCYLEVPQTTIDLLRECVGKKHPGRKPPHDHMLGVRFWDIIRLRGSQTGGNYPFYYIEGGPSINGGKFVRNKGLTSYNAKRHAQLQDEMQADEKNMTKIASEKGRNYSLAQQEIDNEMARIEDIVDSDLFHEDWDNGIIGGDMEDFTIDFAKLLDPNNPATWAQKEEFLRKEENAAIIKDLLNSKYAKEELSKEDMDVAKYADDIIAKYQHKQAIDSINDAHLEAMAEKLNSDTLDDSFFSDASDIDYSKDDEEDKEWEEKMKRKFGKNWRD